MANTDRTYLDLEGYRRAYGLTQDQVADGLALSGRITARRYCIGAAWPPTHVIERILTWSGGRVSLYAMHRRRMEWLRSQGKLDRGRNLPIRRQNNRSIGDGESVADAAAF